MRNIKQSWTVPISKDELRPVIIGATVGLLSSGAIASLLLAAGFGAP